MFCSECGGIIMENEKVCSSCGAKVTTLGKTYERELNDEKGLSIRTYALTEDKIMFKLGDKYISFHKNADKTILFNMIEKIGENYGEDFILALNKEAKNFEGMLQYLNDIVLERYYGIIEIIKDRGNKWGYKDFSEVYTEKVNKTEFKIYPIINYLKVKKEDGDKKIEEGLEKRNTRKESRELSYAEENDTSGKIKADAKNKASGAFHSLINGIGNAKTNIDVKLELKKEYDSKDRREKIRKAIEDDIKNMADMARDLINDKYKGEVLKSLYSEDDKKVAIENYIQLGNKETDEERLDCIREVIQKWGDFEGVYIDALALYPKGIEGLDEILKFFYLDEKEIKSKSKKRKDDIKKLEKYYGKKAMYIGKCLEQNSIFQKYKFKFDTDLNEQFKKVSSKLKKNFVYINDKDLKEENFKLSILALENYCSLEDEVPLILYNYESTYKNVEGILITDKRVYYKNKEGEPSVKEIKELTYNSIAYSIETRKIFMENESTNIFIEKEEDGIKLIDIWTYFIMLIKFSSSINENYNFNDEVDLKLKFYNDYKEVKGYGVVEEKRLEEALKKNSLYHKVKNDFNGDLIHDINVTWGEKTFKKLMNLNYLKDQTTMEKIGEKLEKGKEYYGITEGEQGLILYDNTLLGTGKDGFIITDITISIREGLLLKTTKMSLDKYTKFIMREDKIIFSNETILDLSGIADNEKIEVKRILDIILNLILVRL
ncbi:MAG: hypothetical protein ACRDAU_12475 [Clostridium sp.]